MGDVKRSEVCESAASDDHAGDRWNALAREVRGGRVILFVGAGVSADLGLPTWDDFIGRLGIELGFEPREFLALSPDLRSLAEYYRLEHRSLDALCKRMASEWHVDDSALAASSAHRRIVDLDFRSVYTTNYDDLLERAYGLAGRAFNKVVTADDIAGSDPALPTIVKFHGDLAAPESVILAETDYIRRLSFTDPLDLALTADTLGKGVLFVGYSVSDINLRVLLYRMRELWRTAGSPERRPKSYVAMAQRNRVQERIFSSWGVTPLLDARSELADAPASAFLERLYRLVTQ